jgi:hypothetical protein
MIVLLNGPLGIGKSTLAEALVERVDGSVMLDGDRLIDTNPEPPDSVDYLHGVLTLLVGHHRRHGYRHFVINHIWRTPAEIADLRSRVCRDEDFHCFLLMLSADEHLRRIECRARASALDEREFEMRTYAQEREALASFRDGEVGEFLDVSASPDELVERLLLRLDLR